MTVYITAVTPANAGRHEHITGVRWLDSNNSTSKTMSRQQAVEWIQEGHAMYVAGESGSVSVLVVNADPPYLRTAANGSFTDNLLSLPRY